MVNKTTISELKNNIDKTVTLSGWLYRGRAGGKVLFLIIRDGTGLCQCVVEKGKIDDDTFEQLKFPKSFSASLNISAMNPHLW